MTVLPKFAAQKGSPQHPSSKANDISRNQLLSNGSLQDNMDEFYRKSQTFESDL